MVRETRHLWVGNLPDNIREDRIREHFKRYGRVQSVKLLPRGTKEETGESAMACTVAFMDIKSASKAHTAEHKIDDRTLTTEYYEPAAIPSAASPQNSTSTYSTSPGSTRFPNSHSTPEEHTNFNERFYDRTNSRATEGEYIRRPAGYHDNRGRNRDRGYRNGPFNNIIDRSHRPLNNSWSYDSTRYNNDTGYSTTPTDSNDRRSSDSQSTKKKTKSRSGSRSPSPSVSASSRSPSRSRSQSSSSSSSSSSTRASSSTSSPKSRKVPSSVNTSHQSVVHSDDRRPLAICVRNLPLRSSDTSLKDGLFHEYKKHGKVTWVKVVGQGTERYAIVCFKKPEDVEKALEVSYDKHFFGCKIEVAPYQGCDVEDNDQRPFEAELDEFHPKATRTLFIGNLEKEVTVSDLRKHFDQFGEIIEIDIKKQGAVSSYAFCQYSDIVSVVKAIRTMDGEHLGNNRVKLGFGKSMPTNCVWVDGIVDSVNEKYLTMQFESFGPITQVNIDREKGQALIFYEQVTTAQQAVIKMRGISLRGRRIQVDFASRECQDAFYEHLEKQGHPAERPGFEERRDCRNFEPATVTANRFTRYDSVRPRTASYGSRSNASVNQCNTTAAAIPSPGTPGSVTPRGSSSRSRLSRYADYYDQASTEYAERRYRSYDEYSQGSAASHDDSYEHEYVYPRESPSHVDSLQNDHVSLEFPPPDIRNLQKERVHLLEQLDECPSSGDELISPKKRLKLELDGVSNDVIIEANREHRKVMEIPRTSQVIKHHSRRPSVDSKHTVHERGSYLPHAVCKRRKTAGSDGGSRVHHHDLSGSESVGSSRPGTPLCDERPENFAPTEPRRIPREREGPLSLPLPKFAAQIMNRGSVSVAGIKGQKDNVLQSPPPAATSPRITMNPTPPSQVHVPPPASPPPRPPSLSSNSSDSDAVPHSPSLDERIKSLDEKYEKWSGSRALSASGGDALAKLDASASERFRFKHKLLDLDLKEVQPSEIVKSVMAKRSVFDEDSKRLENVGEKYEPREFNLFPRTPIIAQPVSIPAAPLSAPPVLKVPTPPTQLPKTPTMLSPRSTGSSIIPAKGLQYPFPSHPPLQPAPSLPTTTLTTPPATSTSTPRGSHGDNRLKTCSSASNDNRTGSKVSVNRSVPNSVVVSNLTQVKISDNSSKNGVNIPINSSDPANINSNASAVDVHASKLNRSTKENKNGDKCSDKVSSRRDSSASSGSSPRSECKTRRNSENSVRSDKSTDNCDNSLVDQKDERDKCDETKKEQERLENDRIEKENLEKERIEKERIEKERIEKAKLEKERLEHERLEKERIEKEKAEKEKLEKEKIEKEKLERERIERDKKKEREEKERKEKDERERREREEQLEKERKEQKEREEKERRDREERERREKDDQDRERLEKERKREDERKHKDDNHEKRKEDHSRHRENHSDNRHRENNTDNIRNDKHGHENKNTKDCKTKDNAELQKKDSHESRSNHDNKNIHESREKHSNNEIKREDSKTKHHLDKDAERKKEGSKENRENNIHEKINSIFTDIRDNKEKFIVESRHLSIELDKNRQNESSKADGIRRKERNNSLPANIAAKRRMSLQDTHDGLDESKRIKLSQEYKKLSERRDSKDSKSDDKSKIKHKNSIAKIFEEKARQDKHNSVKENCDRKDRDDKHKSKLPKNDKQKSSKDKSREKESPSTLKAKELTLDKDFLLKLDLRGTEDAEKQKQRKDIKERRKQENPENDERKSEENRRVDERKKEKQFSTEKRNRDDLSRSLEERKMQKKERIRKSTHNSSDATDSDEPKKHSIFDIVDDEPAYISMYDKVKARSCKNMQKQEEEKRQEKLKAKFTQLKQSRAKREEKKRSTSWEEDSDTDGDRPDSKIETKTRRNTKMLILSSDEESPDTKKQRKKHEIYTDSDSEKNPKKSEQTETSDEDRIKIKNMQRKGSKSRIASDSDDDFKNVQTSIKSEIFSDNEIDQGFAELDEKSYKIKDEEKSVKKEKRLSKQELTIEQMNAQIFGDSNSPLPEIKVENKFDDRRVFGDISSTDENPDNKKEKIEIRKKHKKKQKRQKSSIITDEVIKLETTADNIQSSDTEKMKFLEKKRQHSKKDKRKDKVKEDDKYKDKSKKLRKQKSENAKIDSKRDGKMENIFGSLSDDSEHGVKEEEPYDSHAQNSFLNRFAEEKLQISSVYASDSDSISHLDREIHKSEERDRKEEHRKRKEKKRREKEKRMRAELNENSMDYADLGKQLEANIKDHSNDGFKETIAIVTETEKSITKSESTVDIFRFTDGDDTQEIKKEDRKESKEKKKKRKKSKDEKQRHHHHHHHSDKNKIKSPEVKKEPIVQLENIKVEMEKPSTQSPSLPNILDIPSPPHKTPTKESRTSPVPHDSVSNPKTTPNATKEKKFIPGFGAEIDEKLHENAVKSISDFQTPKIEAVVDIKTDDTKVEKAGEGEDKPRVIISQEETEDAVAAILGESFGGSSQYKDCYSQSEPSPISNVQITTLPESNTAEDIEEMRQAVQSLNADEIEAKPETPQSEHELQIDTDSEEPEDISLRYDQPPKTPDMVDLSQPPKTPDIPRYFRSEDSLKGASLVIKSTNLSSPPSLTPIKHPKPPIVLDTRKPVETIAETAKSTATPVLPVQPKPTTTWTVPQIKTNDSTESSKIKINEASLPILVDTSVGDTQPKRTEVSLKGSTPSPPRSFTAAPVIKIAENSTTMPAKPNVIAPVLDQCKIQSPGNLPAVSKHQPPPPPVPMHNMPARVPYNTSLQQKPLQNSFSTPNLLSSRISTPFNRLPITSVMVAKPLQPTTMVLPQSKTALSVEQSKLISPEQHKFVQAVDHKFNQDRTRIVYSTNGPQYPGYVPPPHTRMVVQSNVALQRNNKPPQGLMLPNKLIQQHPYGYVPGNMHPTPYGIPQLSIKESPMTEKSRASPPSEPQKIITTPSPVLQQSLPKSHHSTTTTQSISQPATFIPPQTTAVESLKAFMPVIQETPKLVNTVDARPPQPCVIQQTPPTNKPLQNTTKVITPPQEVNVKTEIKEPEEIQQPDSKKLSPVIVSAQKEKEIENIKTEKVPSVIEHVSVKAEPVQTVLDANNTNEKLSEKKEESVIIKTEKVDDVAADINVSDKAQPIKVKIPGEIVNPEVKPNAEQIKTDSEVAACISKDVEKVDEEKADTDSVVSDISKERLSAEIYRDDVLDSKEDSDYWSAKEVNIDSVIKKVDALCSPDELSDRSSEVGKDDWYDHEPKPGSEHKLIESDKSDKCDEISENLNRHDELDDGTDGPENYEFKEISTRGSRRGGRPRGRKTRGVDRGGMQTRRGKIIKEVPGPVKRGGKVGRPKNERKSSKSESEVSTDVYEFRDESDENKDRPRLILTIKSPAAGNTTNGHHQSTAVVKEIIKEPPVKPLENKDDFVSPTTNTRKSRRLQERDVFRNTVDDTIEDVVRNTAMVTRSLTAAVAAAAQTQTRRSTRQVTTKQPVLPDTPRKSPRGSRKKDRRASETTDDSSEEKSLKNELIARNEIEAEKEIERPREIIKEVDNTKLVPVKEKPHEGLKAAVLRRVKGDTIQEPMNLIDPVTGVLIPMRECEEGRYIPVSGIIAQARLQSALQAAMMVDPMSQQIKQPLQPLITKSGTTKPVDSQPQSVITNPQSSVILHQQKPPQSLKAHVLSAAKVAVPQHQPSQTKTTSNIVQPPQQQTFVVRPNVPITQHLNVNVSLPNLVPTHLSPRLNLPPNIPKSLHHVPPGVKTPQQPPSPNKIPHLTNLQKHMLQVSKEFQIIPKAHVNPMVSTINQVVMNTQMAHMKHQQPQVVMNKVQPVKSAGVHSQQQMLGAAVAISPQKSSHHLQPIDGPTRIIQGSVLNAKGGVEPPKVEVSMGGCVMVPHPTASPQGQPRHVLQAGMPVPAYEASLGEAITHFPPGSVTVRPPHDLSAHHYMHPQHLMYQQYLRQSFHLPRSPIIAGGLEKPSDGQEGEEAPITSPPLEMRRPGSVGLALSGRSAAVPHSLQSPHDRTTDSPQIAQVYSMHSARMQHYHNRYYEPTEPPPAHRPLTSHSSLAALGSDRPMSHISSLATPERPLSSHIPPDRPLSSHLAPDRPLSGHAAITTGHMAGLGSVDRPLSAHLPDRSIPSHALSLGLGAAGNLMGAVARHVSAEAPATQRGLQAATPPHASQVPPQAESLLMLLKQYPCMWQGLLALKNDQAAVQMYFVSGNESVAKCSLPKNTDGSTPPLRIFQRMRLEPPQVEGVARKMQMENEHCMLLALPCGHDHMDVLKQSTNLSNGFITYLQQKQAAGIVNVAAPGTTQPPAYVVHIFPSCDFVNDNLRRIAPSLLERVADIAHLLIVITTV